MKKNVASYFLNIYVLTLAFFVAWMLFFDVNDVFTGMERKDELKQLEKKKAYYQQEIANTKKELDELQNSPAALEKFARERYKMKKDGEDVFIIEDSTALKN
jgi:cell division protein DivIC